MIKKLKIALVVLLTSFFVQQGYSQDNEGFARNMAKNLSSAANTSTNSSLGSAGYFYNPKVAVEGSEYLFDEWDNGARIYTKDNNKFSLKNINLNIKRNSFVSKLGKDSIFTYNMNNIDKIIIDRKIYKNIFSEEGKRVYQVVYEETNFSILKGFSIQTVFSSPNPMVNRKSDRLVRKEVLYLKKDNAVKRFKLTKKRVLGLVSANNKKEVLRYAKDEKLSFRKEQDIHKILEYSNTL
ncbi:MAG: hypothetical protein ACJAVE_000738 [Polaribacter sp.]|jgi:hypothetical protein|tara:strand:- start:2065 stop:2778 length:714 start_codon:yes stop_codon:yes gene_type:complete